MSYIINHLSATVNWACFYLPLKSITTGALQLLPDDEIYMKAVPDAGSCPGLSLELTALSALESITRRSPGLRLGTAIRYFCHSAWLWLRLSVALDKPVTHPGLDFLSVKTMKEYCRDQVTRGLEETPTVSGRQLHRQLEHGTYYQKSKSCQFRLD